MVALADANSVAPDRLSGEVAVVTGAARGIGNAIARRLAAEGAAVAILDRDEGAGRAAAVALVAGGARAVFASCDVARRPEVTAALTQVAGSLGDVTLLVNNAGIGVRASFLELDDDAWARVIGVNLTGAFIVGQEACRIMARAGRGSVVNVASIAAYIANVDLTPYAVSKAGLVALTRMMAFELAPLGIRVNAVAPGTIATEFLTKMVSPRGQDARKERIPMQRFGTPDEVAATVSFLLSADAAYVTGSVLPVEGGLLIGGIRS